MKPTYRLIPKPDLPASEVQLGSLIAHHKQPHDAFYIPESWMYEMRATDPTPFSIEVNSSKTASFGVMASFANMLPIGGSVDGSRKRDSGRWLSSNNTVTKSIAVDDAFLDALSRNAYVLNYFDEQGTKDFWVVSGVKVGWNVSVTDTAIKENELGVSLDTNISGLTLGPSGRSNRSNEIKVHYFAGGPVVFGYELTRLSVSKDGSLNARKEGGEFYNKDLENPKEILRLTVSAAEDTLEGLEEGFDELTHETCKVLGF